MKFLEQSAHKIFQNTQGNFRDSLILVPNNRTSFFLHWYFRKINQNKSSLLPEIMTISQWISSGSLARVIGSLEQLFLLHDLYNQCVVEKSYPQLYPLTIDQFMGLGEVILNDFNEIDLSLTDYKSLYLNLKELAELDDPIAYLQDDQIKQLQQFWSHFSTEKISAQKENYLSLWTLLPILYERFDSQLKDKNLTTSSKLFRKVSTHQALCKTYLHQIDNLHIVGFSGLNKAEIFLFKSFTQLLNTFFYWDVDAHYIDDEIQEAGFFLRKNILQHEFINQIPSSEVFKTEKKIKVIQVSGQVAMTAVIPEILENLEAKNPDDTALILGDESILLSALHALPESIENVNVTIGFPFIKSGVFSFVNAIIEILEARVNGQSAMHYRKFSGLQFHYLAKHLFIHPRQFESDIIIQKRIFISFSFLSSYMNEPGKLILTHPLELASDVYAILLNIVQFFEANQRLQSFEKEAFAALLLQLMQFIQLWKLPLSEGKKLFFKSLKKVISAISIPFEGEPLHGLQVMGLLESRNLDFKNVIVLAANEGYIPKLSTSPTFIPERLRKIFEMSVLEHQDAIFAYYFYRLFHHAESVTLIYNGITTPFQSGEMSRFIRQLMFESSFKFEFYRHSFKQMNTVDYNIVIPKTKDIRNKIKQIFIDNKSTFSPSAINTWIDCSLKFYFQYILQLREKKEQTEEIDARILGDLLHKCLEKIYLKFIENHAGRVNKSDLDFTFSEIIDIINQVYSFELQHFSIDNPNVTGEEIVIKEVIATYLLKILKIDQQYAPFIIQEIEYSLGKDIELKIDDEISVFLGGIIDRIDLKDNVLRIIDYKTGNDIKTFSSIESLFDSQTKDRNKAALQTLYYAWTYRSKTGSKILFKPGIYNVRGMFEDDFSADLILDKNPIIEHNLNDVLDEFEFRLKQLIHGLFYDEIDFKQTDQLAKCSYCNFKEICNRK